MNIKWIAAPTGENLVHEFVQADGMPKTETILGGVDTSNGFSMGWAMLNNVRRELLLRYEKVTAKDDVERYLIFKGLLPASFTSTPSPKKSAKNEKPV